MTNFRLLSITALLPLLVLADTSATTLTDRALGERMLECGMAWGYRYKAAAPDEEALEGCSQLQQDAQSRIGGRCEGHALEQMRLYAAEAWKHLPEGELDRLIGIKEEEIYALVETLDPDAANAHYVRERDCERWLNYSRSP